MTWTGLGGRGPNRRRLTAAWKPTGGPAPRCAVRTTFASSVCAFRRALRAMPKLSSSHCCNCSTAYSITYTASASRFRMTGVSLDSDQNHSGGQLDIGHWTMARNMGDKTSMNLLHCLTAPIIMLSMTTSIGIFSEAHCKSCIIMFTLGRSE